MAAYQYRTFHNAQAAHMKGKIITNHGYFVHDIDKFDAEYFGIPSSEAHAMDPQQRILLQLASHALDGMLVIMRYVVYFKQMLEYHKLNIEEVTQESTLA